MKDFLIGLGLGFAVGAIMVKNNKEVAKIAEKSKQIVENSVSKGKELVEDNIINPVKKTVKQQK